MSGTGVVGGLVFRLSGLVLSVGIRSLCRVAQGRAGGGQWDSRRGLMHVMGGGRGDMVYDRVPSLAPRLCHRPASSGRQIT